MTSSFLRAARHSGTNATYTYNSMSRRTNETRSSTGARTYFADALNRYTAAYDPRDNLVAKINAAGTVYYHQDGLGSAVALTDATGSNVESYTYDAFGAVRILDPSTLATRPTSLFSNRFLFTGREWIAEAGLNDYRNRAYDPELGRFLQTDPIRFDAGDVNLYRYVGNSPIRYADPMGTSILDTIKEWLKGPAKSPEKPIPDPTGWPEVILPTGYTAACIAARTAYIDCLNKQTFNPCNVDCSSAKEHMDRVCDAANKVNEAFQ